MVQVGRTADGATVEVADTGPGIAPEHLEHVFDRFYRADPSRSGPGSGLGLAIARENARLLGGDVEARSELGTGSRFTLRPARHRCRTVTRRGFPCCSSTPSMGCVPDRRRQPMKRLIAMVAVLTVLTAACAESGAQPLGPAPSDEPSSPPHRRISHVALAIADPRTRADDVRALVQLRRLSVRRTSDGGVRARRGARSIESAPRGADERRVRCRRIRERSSRARTSST